MGKKKFKKKCKECEREFVSMNVRKMYCSDNCWQRNSRKKEYLRLKHCSLCGNVFHSGKKTAKFCSHQCSLKSQRNIGTGKICPCQTCGKDFRQKNNAHRFCSRKCKNRDRKMILIGCENCGKIFNRRSDSVKGKKNFCSTTCCGAWNTMTGVRSGKRSPRYKKSIPDEDRIKICESCGKKIISTPKEISMKKYCSRKCKAKGQSFTMTKPHRKTLEILNSKRIWNESEKQIGTFFLDCSLGKGLAIEVMGTYWHGDVRTYKNPKNKMQEKSDRKDKRKKKFLEDNGITVLYIWEDDIENHPEMCEKLILRFKERNGKLSNYHSMNYKVDRGKLILNRERLVPRFEL